MAKKEQNGRVPQVTGPLSGVLLPFSPIQTPMTMLSCGELVTMVNRWALGTVTPSPIHALYQPPIPQKPWV